MPVLRPAARTDRSPLPARERLPTLNTDDALLRRLTDAPLEVLGRVVDASNGVLLARLDDGAEPDEHVVYKPIAGERPLWDFPDGHLAHREVAAYLVAAAGGWTGIPPTVLRQGPAGPGSAQRWVTPVPTDDPFAGLDDESEDDTWEDDDEWEDEEVGPGEAGEGGHGPVDPADDDPGPQDRDDLADLEDDADVGGLLSAEADPAHVQLFDPAALPAGWLPVLSGELGDGSAVVVAHRDDADLRSLAVLDAVVNNSDRKGSHLLVGVDGRLWGIDHGLTFHADDKLRTVLWGWAGEPLPEADVARLARLADALDEPVHETDDDIAGWIARPTDLPAHLPAALDRLLTVDEVAALRARVDHLLRTRRHPHPSGDWPAVPWPPL